jgi:Flp pilus assembly protein TadB
MLWIWIAAVVVALIALAVAGAKLLGQLGGLRRAAVKLQRRQADAAKLQQGAAELEQTLAGLQQRTDELQDRLAALSAEK